MGRADIVRSRDSLLQGPGSSTRQRIMTVSRAFLDVTYYLQQEQTWRWRSRFDLLCCSIFGKLRTVTCRSTQDGVQEQGHRCQLGPPFINHRIRSWRQVRSQGHGKCLVSTLRHLRAACQSARRTRDVERSWKTEIGTNRRAKGKRPEKGPTQADGKIPIQEKGYQHEAFGSRRTASTRRET